MTVNGRFGAVWVAILTMCACEICLPLMLNDKLSVIDSGVQNWDLGGSIFAVLTYSLQHIS